MTVIKARRANNLKKPLGKHWTLTRVINDGENDKKYAFCISDEQENGYIPRVLVERYNLKEEDEGAGFHAPNRPPSGADGGLQIMGPINFDGEPEEILVEQSEDQMAELHDQIDKLISAVEDCAKLSGAVDGLIQRAEKMETEARNFREVATFLHNEITAKQEWLEEEYPS